MRMHIVESLTMIGIATYASTQQSANYDFYIGALRNYREETTNVWLYIMTGSSSPVDYTVETYSGTIATGTLLTQLWQN